MAVALTLADDIDLSRGDMLARKGNQPWVTQDIDAMVCWMTNEPLRPRQKLAIKHTTRNGRALVKEVVTAAQDEVRAGELAPDDVVGAVLALLGAVGREVGGRRHWY